MLSVLVWNRTRQNSQATICEAPYRRLALGGLVMGAMLLRIGIALALPRQVRWDEMDYLVAGRNLLTGQGFTTGLYPEIHYAPLYPIVSGLLYFLVRDFELASNVAHALFGGLLLLPVFVIARRIYGVQIAWLVSFWMAIFPAFTVSVLYWGTMTEPLYLCLLYGGLASLLVGLEDTRIGMFALAGMLFGLAYLTRPEAVGHFVMLLVFGLVWLLWHTQLRALRVLRAMGWFALPFVLLAAPYVWYLHAQTEQWMLTTKLDVTWEAGIAADRRDWQTYDRLLNSLDSTERTTLWHSKERFQRGWSLLQRILEDPNRCLQSVKAHVRKLLELLFDRHVFWYGLLIVVTLALFIKPWDRQRLGHEAFLMAAIVPLAGFLPFYIYVRYFAPALPVLLMWTARGALDLGRWLQDTLELCRAKPLFSRPAKAMLCWTPALVVTLFLLAMIPVAARLGLAQITFGHKEAGLWLQANTLAGAKILASDLAVAMYADRLLIPSPHADWPRFLRYARAHGADYLVVDDRELTGMRPQLAFLLEPQTLPSELQLVFSFEEPRLRTLVYRIFPEEWKVTKIRNSDKDYKAGQ